MATYDIPLFPTRRLRYYNNQFLNEQDFIDDQAHHIAHERAQLRALCVAGVCEGLTATYAPATKLITVSPGVAVDTQGRLIVLDTATAAPALTGLADGEYQLYVAFNEPASDLAPQGKGAQDNTRWHQVPTIASVAKGSVPAGGLVLCGFRMTNGALAGDVFATGRQWSGLRLPGPAGAPATLVNRNDGTADGAQLTGTLTLRRDTGAGQLGPVLTLMNGTGSAGVLNSGAAIDFDGYDPAGQAPTLRLQSLNDAQASSHFVVSTKQPGAATNLLQERLRVTSGGSLQFTNELKDKVVVWDGGSTDRYGMGLSSGNLSLFYPPGSRFSLRQNSFTGAEVLTVDGAGRLTLTNAVVPKLGNDANSGIYFPANPGGGAGDEAFLRYYVQTAPETCKLMLGINNDFDDTIGLWQAGAERLTIYNGRVGINIATPGSDLSIAGRGATIEVGAGAADKEVNAGKFSYRGFSDWLDIVGGGPTSTRGIQMWAEAGTFFTGTITPKLGNDATSGIYFPTNPGLGAGDEAFLRYYAVTGETCKLMLGINNDADDTIGFWQAGAERMTVYNGGIGIGTVTPDRPLTVFNPTGAYINTKITSGIELLIGADSSGGIVSTISNHNLQLRAGGNVTRMTIMTDGSVGIGTTPDRSLTVFNAGGTYINTKSGVGVELLMGADGSGGIVSTMSNHNLQLRSGGNATHVTVRADGTTAFTGQIGVSNNDPLLGLPANWGGGVHTWDVVVEGTGISRHGFLTQNWDLAETFNNVEDALEPGDVVAADPTSPERLVRSREPQQPNLLGVISEKPGFLLGVNWENPEMGRPLALAGRVPVKVNLEGGAIRIGDLLTSSSEAGTAKRASRAGRVIGMALQAFDGNAGERGKVIVFVNPHWWPGQQPG